MEPVFRGANVPKPFSGSHPDSARSVTFLCERPIARSVDPTDAPPAAAGDAMKKFEGPVTVERSFKVDGKMLTVLVTFPAAVVAEVGMEPLLMAANRAIVTVESKAHAVDKLR